MSAERTGIAWTDATWNPVRGCSRVSAGCEHCYAERVAARFSGSGQPYEGLVTRGAKGPRWTGKVRLVPELLDWPLRKRKPLRIFVNSMSDLFHEDVPDEFVLSVFRAMGAAHWHTFQVLTKRPERMLALVPYLDGEFRSDGRAPLGSSWHHVHLGVSVEDQAAADERIPLLLQTPAAVRFVSYEPALGPVDFGWIAQADEERDGVIDALRGKDWIDAGDARCANLVTLPRFGGTGVYRQDVRDCARLSWVIVGGESGPRARLCNVEWIRSAVAQCKAAGVPCFVKQDSGRKSGEQGRIPDELWVKEFPRVA